MLPLHLRGVTPAAPGVFMQAQPGNPSNLSAMIDMLGGPATGPSGVTGATAPAPAAAAAAGLQTPAVAPALVQAGGATLVGATTSAPNTLMQTSAADGALAPRMPRRMSEMPLLRPPIAAIWGYRPDAFATAHRFERHALGHARRLRPGLAWPDAHADPPCDGSGPEGGEAGRRRAMRPDAVCTTARRRLRPRRAPTSSDLRRLGQRPPLRRPLAIAPGAPARPPCARRRAGPPVWVAGRGTDAPSAPPVWVTPPVPVWASGRPPPRPPLPQFPPVPGPPG